MSLLDYTKNWNACAGTYWNMSAPVKFIKYPETTNFKNGLLIVSKPVTSSFYNKVKCVVTIKNETGEIVDYIPDRLIEQYPDEYDETEDFLPKCTLTGNNTVSVTSTSGIELTFSYRDINDNIQSVACSGEIKTDKGYITHRKFSTNDGTFSFKFIPLGLSVGEIAKVQVGLGKYTDIVSKRITVV